MLSYEIHILKLNMYLFAEYILPTIVPTTYKMKIEIINILIIKSNSILLMMTSEHHKQQTRIVKESALNFEIRLHLYIF